MSADLPTPPLESNTDLSKLRRLIPVKLVDPTTSGFIEILVSKDCEPALDKLLPYDDQVKLARLIAAHPEAATSVGEVEGGQDKNLSFLGLIVSFWDVRALGRVIIYHIDKADGTPPSDPSDKTNPYWRIALTTVLSAAIAEIVKRLPGLFLRHGFGVSVEAAPLLRDARAVSSITVFDRMRTGENIVNYFSGHGSPNTRRPSVDESIFHTLFWDTIIESNLGGPGAPSLNEELTGYLDSCSLGRVFGEVPDTPYSSEYLLRVGIRMLDNTSERTTALLNAIAELRAHVDGTQPLRGFVVATVPRVDVASIRLLTNCSPDRFAALLGISLDRLIAWECGEVQPNADQSRLLSLISFYPEEVVRQLELVNRRPNLH